MIAVIKRGTNVALTREVPNLKSVVLGVSWDAGSEAALASNLVTAVIMCGKDGHALSDEHFVFFNQLTSPDLSVAQLTQALGGDDEQVEVDLDAVPAEVTHIVVLLYVNEGAKRTLGRLKTCELRVLNLEGNAELVRTENLAAFLKDETAVTLGELYRHDGGWKFKTIGDGYKDGINAALRDRGLVP